MAGRLGPWMMSVRAKSCLIIGTLNIDRPGEGPSSGSLIGRRPSQGRSRPSIQGQVSNRPRSPTKEPQLAPTTSTAPTYPDGLKYHSRESSASSHTARRPHERVDTFTSSSSKSSSRSNNRSQATDSFGSRLQRRNTPPPRSLRSHPNSCWQAGDRFRDYRH
jgi:hypothetical protein